MPICLTAAITAIADNIEKTTAIMLFNQKVGLNFDSLNVELKKNIGRTKSRGMKPKAPIKELRSPKNGSIAAKVVAMTIITDRSITLGITLRTEN